MHQDIEKLINLAKEGGELTDKQKEIILRKAEKLGEDVDEIEMILETTFSSHSNVEHTQEKRTRCPNCGAIISDTLLQCPECGYILQKENVASSEAREWIASFQKALLNATNSSSASKRNTIDSLLQSEERAIHDRKLSVINTFTMPVTKEGLSQMLEFSYSNYISTDTSDWMGKDIKKAWYGRYTQAYNALQRIATDDASIKSLLEQYSLRLNKEKRKISHDTKVFIGLIIAFILMGIVVHNGIKGERKSHEIVIQYLQEGDYEGARNAAETYQDRNLVSTSEVLYLISIGDIKQAKIVASTIEDKEKRKEMQQVISEAERQ